MSLAAQRAELATGYEMMLHTEETAAATQQLERASAKAERKEAAFLEAMRPRRSQAFVAPILSRSERLAVRAAEIAEDHAASSIETEAKERLAAKGKTTLSDPFLFLRLKTEIQVERAKAAATVSSTVSVTAPAPAVSTVSSVSGGAGGSRADAAMSWRRSAPTVSTASASTASASAPASSAPASTASASVPRTLPRALDTLLADYPVCYKAKGEGRYEIELHRKKLRDLCVKERRDIGAKEVEASLLRALETTGLCAISAGSWSALCVITV